MVANIPLPRWAYVPGPGQSPDLATLDVAKLHVPVRYEDCVPSGDVASLYGLALNDAGFFWESHEVLEAVWKAAPKGGCDRILLRAFIQIANANLKLKMNRPNAARRLLQEAHSELLELASRKLRGPLGGLAHEFDGSPLRLAIVDRQQAIEAIDTSAPIPATKCMFLQISR